MAQNILFLTRKYRRQIGDAYYCDFLDALKLAANVQEYGPGYDGYDPAHSIHDLTSHSKPDLIVLGQGWLRDVMNPSELDPHPRLGLANINIPKFMIINKEYKLLDSKFRYAQANNVDKVFTVLHRYEEWTSQYGIPVKRLSFAVDPSAFQDYGEEKKYDIGFSGATHTAFTSIRQEMIDRIHRMKVNFTCRLDGVALPIGEAYSRLINSSKLWLSTTSAVDIVGPRYYEVMASGSLLVCNRSNVYEDLLEDGKHCIMVDVDLEDKIRYYLANDAARANICKQARDHVVGSHTWQHRAQQLLNEL